MNEQQHKWLNDSLFAYYSGAANPSLEFNGSKGASLINIADATPFILQVQNISLTTKSFYLSQGLLYTRGSETPGQLRTGSFSAIVDPGSSLIGSTSNSITIEQFIAYCQSYPTYIPLIQGTTTSATPELATVMQRYRQGMINDEEPIIIPMRKYARGDQYNLQFVDIKEPLYISAQDIIIVQVAGSSTLTLNLYPLVSKNTRAELHNDILTAKKMRA